MPGFQFELGQLVNVPGKDQQGRVSGRMEFVGEETVYQVKWLADDCLVYKEMFKQGEIVTALQPKPIMPDVSFASPAVTKPKRNRRKSRR